NHKEAVKWFSKAARQGHASAQYNLGLMYANGQGIPQDYVMAHKYFNIAASSGVKKANKNRDSVAKLMTASQIEKAQNLASEWMRTH
ncbi:tetratricopeptide repeat protein, partial [Bathymodiolus platifrons methanotrophic gill symbiont]|uniref:tetratricopeptide repeat protein n=1 Tax=Bathymodiolus platifrons methanotrophic gill symbiont TaxID=113268 RepID=UPI001125102C